MMEQRFSRGRTPGPSTSLAPVTRQEGGVTVTVRPISAETQPWNEWPDGTTRLFNDGAGYLWSVEVSTEAEARWNPGRSHLAVNDTEQVFAPAETAEEVLLPLLEGASLEDRLAVPGDLGLRLRGAGAFRDAYLPTSPVNGAHLVLFPAPAEGIHAVAMELTLAFDVTAPAGAPHPQDFVFLFE